MASRYIKEQQKGQIDLLLLWKVLQGNIIKIGIVAVLLAAAVGLFRYTNSSPFYRTDSKFLVSGVQINYTDKTYSEIQSAISSANLAAMGANIAYNTPYILNEDKALNNICDYLKANYGDNYARISRKDIRGMLNVSVDNQIVIVGVASTDKQVAMDVATAVQNTLPASLDYYFGVENKEGVENIDSVAKAITMVSEDNVTLVGRNVTKYTLLGFAVGLVLAYLFCLLRTYFDNTIYNEEDLKNHFNVPVVGQIPTWENTKVGEKAFKDKSRRDHIKGSKDSKSPDSGNLMSDRDYEGRLLTRRTPFAITEAFKALRTNLCYTTKGQKCAVYGVTSAYVSAGKSLIISNMAVSFAQMDKKVLLVDCDLRCPVIHKIFSLDNKVEGMSDLLAGMCAYEDIYRRNGGYENLNIITSGKVPPNPAELLASDNMKSFIETVKAEYDVVLIDLPPICEVSDAGIIYDLVTGYTFVVRSGYSDRRMIELAVETMEGFGANLSGFILNDIDIKSGDYYKNKYYSGYSKYRFRSGKSGYYRHFKYGYYKGYYSRYSSNRYYQSSYSSSYSRAHEEASQEEDERIVTPDTEELLNSELEVLDEIETADTYEEDYTEEETAEEETAEEETAKDETAEEEITEEETAEEEITEEEITEEETAEEETAEEETAEVEQVEEVEEEKTTFRDTDTESNNG